MMRCSVEEAPCLRGRSFLRLALLRISSTMLSWPAC